jgi:hypothetical protein
MRNRLPCCVVGGVECGCSVVVCLKVKVRISRVFANVNVNGCWG